MPVHPEAQQVIDALAASGPQPAPGALSPAQMRVASAAAWARSGQLEPVGRVYDSAIPGPAGDLPVRVFAPRGAGPFPVLVWLHGGGWVLGTLDENEGACRALCRQAGAVVVSVGYRLAPENRFPAAAQDAFAAACWAAASGGDVGGDPSRVAVAGESAGGNLAAACALMARDRGGPDLALQLLVSPVLGLPGDGRQSYAEFAEGYFMGRASMEYFFEQYPRDVADLANPYLVPLAAGDLSGVAPALVMTAEYEVLRDEGEEYAGRLAAAGVGCELVRYDGQIHGFFGLLDESLSVSAEAHARAAAALRRAFAGSGAAGSGAAGSGAAGPGAAGTAGTAAT